LDEQPMSGWRPARITLAMIAVCAAILLLAGIFHLLTR